MNYPIINFRHIKSICEEEVEAFIVKLKNNCSRYLFFKFQLASSHEMGLFYNEKPTFRVVKFQTEWNITSAQNQMS